MGGDRSGAIPYDAPSMSVNVGKWVVALRIGKPVEVNALRVMAELARLLGERYEATADRAVCQRAPAGVS